ncbi:MAG: hypothetical protein IKE58_02830 [Blautia sp.]|nr:hypothetical protein [Blautia sp.]
MNQKNQNSLVTTGIPSIFLIFSVLCLVILSLLALGSSRLDLKTSELSLEYSRKYYSACNLATDILQSLREELSSSLGGQASDRQSSLFRTAADLADKYISDPSSTDPTEEIKVENFSIDASNGEMLLSIRYTDRLCLYIEGKILPESSSCLSIDAEYVVPDKQWTPDVHQNVFLPSETILH